MRKTTAFIMAFAFLLIGCFGTYIFTKEILIPRQEDSGFTKGMEEILWYLDSAYYQEPDLDAVRTGAYKGAITALGDPYSEYLTGEEYQDLMDSESGQYSGIGVTISLDEDTGAPYALIIHHGSPAEAAGVQVGDIFTGIDGTPIDPTMSLSQIAMKLRGEAGTAVKLTVLRDGKTIDIPITRDEVVIDKVEYRMLSDEIGYIKILEFNGNCMEVFDQAIRHITEKGAKGLVLDLRDNPGGYVDYATAVADVLMPKGSIVTTKDRAGREQTVYSDADSIGLPVSVLMNGGSASASEILAGALHDSGVGKVVGVTSYGKALVQRYYPLHDSDGVLKVTIAAYFTPSGANINKKGIEPDYRVELNEEQIRKPSTLNMENDSQLQKAIEVLTPRMK